jgi:putative oxidoreductase
MKLGRLFLRTVVGGYFVGHGTQKLFGWFGGGGLDGTAQMFGSLGMRPPKAHALAAGLAETGGGAAIVLGTETPLAASTLIATMITAIRKVHGANGPWSTNGGYEYNLVLIAALAGLAETGPGHPSIDTVRDSRRHGPAWALIAVALGFAGSFGADAVTKLFPEPEAVAADAPAAAVPAPDSATGADSGAAEPTPAPTDAAEPAPADEGAPAGDNGASSS